MDDACGFSLSVILMIYCWLVLLLVIDMWDGIIATILVCCFGCSDTIPGDAPPQTAPPSPDAVEESALAVLKNTAVALSSCVYQALCDSDAFKVKQKDGLVRAVVYNIGVG